MSNDNDDIDLDLLDRNVEDIEDLPSFEVPPVGTYVLLLSASTKRVNDKPSVSFDCEVVNTVDLKDKNAKEVVPGSKFNTLFFIDNDTGLGFLKQFIAPFVEHFKETNLKVLVKDHIQNLMISATVDHRTDKDDKDKKYAKLKNVVIQ